MTAKAAAPKQERCSPDEQDPLITVAGNGTAGFSGDGGPPGQAQLAFPADVAVGRGAVFIADHANHRVRRIDGSGVLTTVAGDGLRGFAGDGADAVRARLGFPAALAVDADGGVLIADAMNHRIRRIDPSGVIDTVAGDGSRGGDGDGGPADRAQLDAPCALAVDGAGSLYIGEAGSPRVRRVGGDGAISTVVAAAGRSGAADAGEAFLPAGLAVDASGRLYIADPVGRRVLLLGTDGTLRVLAGPPGGNADATAVDWNAPCAVAVDSRGFVYVADMNGHRVWRLADGVARVVVGPDPAVDVADEAAERAIGISLAYPCGLAVDPAGRLLVADNFHHRIAALPLTTAASQVAEPKPDQNATGPEPGKGPEPDRADDSAPDTDRGTAAETAARLLVRQEVGVEIPRGGSELIHVRVSSTDAWAPGRVEHRFTAPTGLFFDGRATCAYYRLDGSVVAAPEPTAAVREDGGSLSVMDEPRLNTPGNPAAALVYTLGVRAGTAARPGRYTDGRAVIAGEPEVRLRASVLGDDED
ncbi:NHL repeat-containing protein [Streptomyces herbicida]|uniref:serine/threonine protein kinase n=1 Tax=Streptomyces herbicida TaxID=3065675 RepID=UPI00292EB594|nr:serine/threonine protein kinase [Streptomyces sp. NEAU-HV9]